MWPLNTISHADCYQFSIPGHDHGAIAHALVTGPRHHPTASQHGGASSPRGLRRQVWRQEPGIPPAPPFRLPPALANAPHVTSQANNDYLNEQAATLIQIESLQGITSLDAAFGVCDSTPSFSARSTVVCPWALGPAR